jgi:hypothetical protein
MLVLKPKPEQRESSAKNKPQLTIKSLLTPKVRKKSIFFYSKYMEQLFSSQIVSSSYSFKNKFAA